ncbi:MAG: cysteine desulfurase [Verrucomicrobia bacterium]|nr:MAG: cysteine desulfurase [Verrucomicrobiota bacterium]
MIYLDNNSTTAPLPEVIDAVTNTLSQNWGNPSSAHEMGRNAREALESARYTTASACGIASPASLVFTASGTESINLGFSCLLSPDIRQILISSVEHSAVLRAAERWADGRKVLCVPVDAEGALDLDYLRWAASKLPSLVSVGFANNETGVIADIASVSAICREAGSLLHVDAIQAVGKLPLHLDSLDCAAASLSAHKFHGPPGCGILFLKQRPVGDFHRRIPAPGHQQQGLRAGTENLPSIVGCGVAASLLQRSLEAGSRVESLRNQLEINLLEKIPGSEVHGRLSLRLSNTISLYCPGRNAADLVAALNRFGVAVSAGAACSSGGKSSHVIRLMGFSEERANGTLRFSLSCHTTSEEIVAAATMVEQAFNLTPATSQ